MSAEIWLEQLHENGYRLTDARRAVVETVEKSTHALTPVQRMQLAEVNAKLGDMVPRQAAQAGGGGAVTINFIRSNEKSVTFEAHALTVQE